jgi:hypothetical protein
MSLKAKMLMSLKAMKQLLALPRHVFMQVRSQSPVRITVQKTRMQQMQEMGWRELQRMEIKNSHSGCAPIALTTQKSALRFCG